MEDAYKKRLLNALDSADSKSISDTLFKTMRDMIIEGEMPAGYVLPNENAMCELLGIGRGTLREAYKALDSYSLIIRSKSGTYINEKKDITKLIPFNKMVEKSDLNDLLEFRIMIEAENAAHAAQRATKKNIYELAQIMLKMRENSSDIKALAYYDTKFHTMISKASQNTLLYDTMTLAAAVFEKGSYYAYNKATEVEIDATLDFHARILEAIAKGDSKTAHDLMREHVHEVAKIANTIEKNENELKNNKKIM